MPALDKVFWNGRIVPSAKAALHVDSPALKYGASVFEGLRAYYNPKTNKQYVLLLEEHSRRLLQSMRLLRLEHEYDLDYIMNAVLETCRANDAASDLHIRQTVYLDGDGAMEATGPVSMSVVATARSRPRGFDQGIACQVSSWMRIADNVMPPRIKCSANYINGRYAMLQAKQDGYDNAVMLNRNGHVAEAPGACLFIVRDGVPTTPGPSADILESITRAKIIELFWEYFDADVVERDVHRTELYACEEAFLCGTAAEITPVVSFDRLPVGEGVPGPITRKLQELMFDGIARGGIEDHADWRTEV
jgi:branched-chain amino acid aminotransferase